MKYFDVLALPLRTFWSFNRQVDRLRAEAEQRQLRVLVSSESPEGVKALAEHLEREIGMPVVVEKALDTKTFAELQKKFSGKRMASDTHTE